jgi:ABC-type lipoprotein release transport system permease subunit
MAQRADAEMGADLFRVRGIFHSIAPAIGRRQLYLSIAAARSLLGVENVSHQLLLQLVDPRQSDQLATQLKASLGPSFEVRSWGELMPVMKRMEALTDSYSAVLAAFVYFLVGLGVLNTMLMSVLERSREFGVLMALGTRPAQVLKVVLAESFWIATVSVLIGGALGAFINWKFSQAGFVVNNGGESIQLEGLALSTLIKTKFSLVDVARASAFVYLMALVVGIYPASRITRMQPAEALRRT